MQSDLDAAKKERDEAAEKAATVEDLQAKLDQATKDKDDAAAKVADLEVQLKVIQDKPADPPAASEVTATA